MQEPVVAIADMPMLPFGGALTFADADEFDAESIAGFEVDAVMARFEMLLANIRTSGLSPAEKVAAITALTEELRDRVDGGGDPGSTMVFKDNTGQYRWVAVHSNRFEDRTKETFSEASHKAWVDRVWRVKEFPALRLWHIPIDVGRADWVDYDTEGFVLSSGTFNKGMEDVAERLSKMKGLGCSHGYLYRQEDFRDGVYHAYRSYEVSVLPARRVANDLTAFFAEEEVPMLTAERKSFLVDVMGEDRTKAMEDSVRLLGRIAREKGLSYKSLEEDLLADVADEMQEMAAGTRAFPPEADAAGDTGTATDDQQQKCPDCDAMVPAGQMAQHREQTHGQAPADASVAAPEAVATAPAAAAQAQQGVTLPSAAPAAAAAPATVASVPAALSPGAVIGAVGEILEGVGHMLEGDGDKPDADAETDPEAEQAAAFAEANKGDDEDDEAEGEPDADANKSDDEDGELMTAFKSVLGPMMQPLLTQMAAMQQEIIGLKADRGDDIAATIRPRVGPDARGGATASRSDANVITDPKVIDTVRQVNGAKSEDSEYPAHEAVKGYIGDVKGIMRGGIGVAR